MTDLLAYFVSYNYVFEKLPFTIFDYQIPAHIAAFVVSFCISFPLGFFLNKFIVFTNSSLRGRVQLLRYGMAVVASIGLSYVLLRFFVEIIHFYPTPSKAITTVLVAIFSYFSQQYFTFKVKGKNASILEESK